MKHGQDGFTITEVVIATVLVAGMVAVITGFGLTTLRSYSINAARAEILSDANLAIEVINRDIRLSANVDVNNRWEDPHAPGAPDDELSWESSDDTLVLVTAALDENRDIIFSDSSRYITEKNNHIYYVQDGELRRRVIASPHEDNAVSSTCPPEQASESCRADSVFAENVTTFSVEYIDRQGEPTTPDNARSVEIVLGLSADRFGQTLEVFQETRMVFRNE
jgi:type II secretory pathway component PulJ